MKSSFWKYYMLPFCAAGNMAAWLRLDYFAIVVTMVGGLIIAASIDRAEKP